jgi:hypothetical protein
VKIKKGKIMPGKSWNDNEQTELIRLFMAGKSTELIAKSVKRTHSAVASKIKELRTLGLLGIRPVVSQSPARIFDDQITAQGDILILPDVEAPYHNADWINKCIDLALTLNVKQLCVAGDFVHFANFSQWAGNFQPQTKALIDNPKAAALLAMMDEKQKAAFVEFAEEMRPSDPGDGPGPEMQAVRKVTREISGAFETIYYIMGNHEHRKIRLQGFTEGVDELKRFLELGENWKISSYYYMFLAGKTISRIEHPIGAGPRTAIDIAIQEHQHVFMGHSHRLARQKDPSGDLWAIQMGHCVDEKKRLQYVMQRTIKRDAHALGALLWYDGYPWLLEQETPFEKMKRMA